MKCRAFLDANVLVPYDLTCLLLGLAEQGVIEVRWSERVLAETSRSLSGRLGVPPAKASKRIEAMRRGFPEASVAGYERHEPHLVCDAKDRHVAAAAIEAGATHLVTANVQDFDDEELSAYGVRLVHPDDFLVALLDEDRFRFRRAVATELAHRGSSDEVAEQFVNALARLVPSIAERLASGQSNLRLLAGWLRAPETPVTRDEARRAVLDYLRERAMNGVLLASGFLSARLSGEGQLETTWEGDETVNGPLLLKYSPFGNLAELVAIPLAFDNEQGRQLRQHVTSVYVMGEFGVGTETAASAYSRGTGIPLDWLVPDDNEDLDCW